MESYFCVCVVRLLKVLQKYCPQLGVTFRVMMVRTTSVITAVTA